MNFFKKNPLFVAFFVLILGPTIILSFFSFRNILNESYLAEKNFNEHQQSFKKEVSAAIKSEENNFFKDVKNASMFLYEQPQSLMDFGKSAHYKSVDGVKAAFLFNGDTLIYPHLPLLFRIAELKEFSTAKATPLEREIFQGDLQNSKDSEIARSLRVMHAPLESRNEQVLNLLGLVRQKVQSKKYDEADQLLAIIEHGNFQQGYLQANLTAAIRQLHFEILVTKGEHKEAEQFCLNNLRAFFAGENIGDIATIKFFFESMLDQILSFENLSENSREELWNLRENLSREIKTSEYYTKHYETIQALLDISEDDKDGLSKETNDNELFFKMSHPWLPGNQVIIGILDKDVIEKQIVQKIKSVAKDWNDVPYSIRNAKDSLLAHNLKGDEQLLEQREISSALHLELSIYKRSESELAKETAHKVILMTLLIVFSLITVIAGIVFMFRSIHQERSLLAMKANFLSSISHELKTPLTSIKMFAEMMAKGRVKKIERIPEYANMICKETTRLENLVGAILNYTRMENGRSAFMWERLNLATAAEKVYENVERIAHDRGLTIDKHFDPDNFITGDYTAVYSMIQNLIENAIKYTNPPGEIHVRVYADGDKAVFEVQDTGVGIALSEQKNIFNDFYRVGDEMTRSTKGSGLGLAIVKRAADAHKATIALASKPGVGSTFSVKFRKAE